MGKGSQDPTSTTTVSGGLPEYVLPFYSELMERTASESRRPYDFYSAPRLTDFSPEQEAGFQAASKIGQAGVPEALQAGTLRAAQAAAYGQPYDAGQIRSDIAASKYTPGVFGTGSFIDPDVASEYMNPFIENVIDAQRRREQQRFDETVPQGISARAVQQGAFGGSREALQQGLAQARLDERLMDQDAALRARAYQEAQRAYVTDAERRLKEQQFADMAAQQESILGLRGAEMADVAAQAEGRLGLEGEQLGLEAAARLADLGGLEQRQGLIAADILGQVGAQKQAQEQAELDIDYSDFLAQRDYPKKQLSYLSGILQGVPVSPQSETAMFQQGPSLAQQLLGYGLGGLGLYRSIYG
jgi:hypothetical protein|tara:strand:+ start:1153 stop:2226 length:1074 start_codon:yes stop_codon:yes gene_type:complete